MHEQWPKLRKAIEGGIHAIEKGEKGGYRVHVGSAEHIAAEIVKHSRGEEKEHAKQVADSTKHAFHQIEFKNGLSHLQTALGVAKNYAKDGAA